MTGPRRRPAPARGGARRPAARARRPTGRSVRSGEQLAFTVRPEKLRVVARAASRSPTAVHGRGYRRRRRVPGRFDPARRADRRGHDARRVPPEQRTSERRRRTRAPAPASSGIPEFNVVLGDEPAPTEEEEVERMSEPDRVSLAFIWDTDVAPLQPAHVHAHDGVRLGGRLRRRVRQQQQQGPARGSSRPTSTQPEPKIAQLLQLDRLHRRRHDPELPEGDRDQGHVRQLQLQRRAVREVVGRQHRLRHHRADRRDAREDEARRPRRAARPVAHPERRATSTPASATPTTTPATSTRSRGSGARPASATTRRRSAARSPTGTRSTSPPSRASRRSSTRRATRSRWRCSR